MANTVIKLKAIAKGFFRKFGVDVQLANSRDAFFIQKKLLSSRNVSTIVDAGAYMGEWTEKYRLAFPNANIFAFEPFAETAKTYKQKFDGDSKVKLYQSAIGESVGNATFHVNNLAATNSLYPADEHGSSQLPDPTWVTNKEKIVVPVMTLDQLAELESIDRIGILKMDIQGGELNALKGAKDLLGNGKIDLVYTELLVGPTYKGQGQYFDVCRLLDGYGYSLYSVYNLCTSLQGRLGWVDGIFVHRSLINE